VPDLDGGDMIVTMTTSMSHIETSFDLCKQTLSAVLSHNRNNFWSTLVFTLVFRHQVSATSMQHFVSLRIARIALVSLSSPTVSPVSPRIKSVSYRYRAMNIRNIDFWPSLPGGLPAVCFGTWLDLFLVRCCGLYSCLVCILLCFLLYYPCHLWLFPLVLSM
jgi:hypothetical protein